MSQALANRINALTDQEAVHYVNMIAAAAIDVPELGELCRQFNQPDAILNAESDDVQAAQSARKALLLLNAVDGGAQIVEAAIAQPAPRPADFGLISGAVLLIIAYVTVTSRIKIKIAGVEIEKEGIAGEKQVSLASGVLTEFAKAVL